MKIAKENPNYVKGRAASYKYCDKDISGVYIIINDKTREFYIGSSIDIGRRLSHHFGSLKRNKSICERLQDNFNENSYEDFSFFILYRSELESYIREKELELIEDNFENPLLLNTATLNNSWVDSRNEDKVLVYKEKLSVNASKRIGDKNHFFGKTHTDETKAKISMSHIGKEPLNNIPIVINGVKYNSMTDASRITGVHVTTIKHRVDNENELFSNWYIYDDIGDVRVLDDRLLFDPSHKPSGLYEVFGELFTYKKDVMVKHSIKSSTLDWRFKSKSFPEWVRII